MRSVILEMRCDGEVSPGAETLQLFRRDLVVANVKEKLRGVFREAFPEKLNRKLPDGPGSFLTANPGKDQQREDR